MSAAGTIMCVFVALDPTAFVALDRSAFAALDPSAALRGCDQERALTTETAQAQAS